MALLNQIRVSAKQGVSVQHEARSATFSSERDTKNFTLLEMWPNKTCAPWEEEAKGLFWFKCL